MGAVMGDWRKMGHGMRRRQGAPSSTYGAASATGGINMDGSQEALNSMNQGARTPIGANVPAAVLGSVGGNSPHNPDMVRAKYAMQLQDPALGPTDSRKPVVNNSTERMGAAFGIKANHAPIVEHAAGATQANGKVVPSSFPRSDVAFGVGMQA